MRKLTIAMTIAISLLAVSFAYRYYLITELRKPVLAELSDPDSALFRNERIGGNWLVTGSILCGEVNSKNRMGGYIGYMPFTSWGKISADIGVDDLMSDVVNVQCEDI